MKQLADNKLDAKIMWAPNIKGNSLHLVLCLEIYISGEILSKYYLYSCGSYQK